MRKNIQDKFTPWATLQSYRFMERWVKAEATLVSGKSAFQVMRNTEISPFLSSIKFQ
jgi:hypothetical protein